MGPAQTSAAAAGMTRNGVMISVRTTLRPMNLRSSSSAKAVPKIIATSTATTVMTTERRVGEHLRVVAHPGPVRAAGNVEEVVLEAVPQRDQERDLGHHDRVDERRQQRQAPLPGLPAARPARPDFGHRRRRRACLDYCHCEALSGCAMT